jgi:hypothetical protein
MPRAMRIFSILVYALVFFATTKFFLYVQDFPPFSRAITVSELGSTLGPWTGTPIRVQGEIVRLFFIPEDEPPYNYGLMDPGTNHLIGLTWPNGDIGKLPEHKIVTVTGIIVEGWTRSMRQSSKVAFLKADNIEV